jgi:dihydroneopterin aldolase
MDTIIIRDLEVAYHVGVTDGERAHAQRLLLTLELGLDFQAAAASDDLSHTIDYYAVSQRLLRFGEGRQWKLIETLAHEITSTIQQEFHPSTLSVEVKKFVIPETAYVAVRVSRGA